ncbi:MAG: DUF4422 domain-containing protein [Victivallales bacterium]|nr:DUF4422 domain-containing protein [Victivallales bacterium]
MAFFIKDMINSLIGYMTIRSFPPVTRLCGRNNVRIFVLRHKDDPLPAVFSNRKIYVPLNCGTADFSKTEPYALSDSEGENISRYNPMLNEATGIWWIGKHLQELGNPDFIGIDHYRRYLQWSPKLMRPGVVFVHSGIFWKRIREWFVLDDRPDITNFFVEFFKRIFPEREYLDFEKYLKSHTFCSANLMLTDRATFMRYFYFIDRVLGEAIRMIDSDAIKACGLAPEPQRTYGYFFEQMTSYWLFHEHNMRRVKLIRTRLTFLA